MKVPRFSALRTGRLHPQQLFLVLIPVTVRVDPRAIVRPEGLCHWKIPVFSSKQVPNVRLSVILDGSYLYAHDRDNPDLTAYT
jgi:hypothetical protein